jgi:cytochrome c nitrite reductase small subunit
MRPSFTVNILISALLGVAVGVGGYTFIYAKGYSYLANDPASCVNCHIMREQYDGWVKSSHRMVATCNDCHTPHNLVGKYFMKARNGFFHSLAFTTGRFPDSIEIKSMNHKVTEQACRYCHASIVMAVDTSAHGNAQGVSCTRCHTSVGHAEGAGGPATATLRSPHDK